MEQIKQTMKEYLEYLPPLTKQKDFDTFWKETIAQAKAVPLHPMTTEIDFYSKHVKVYDISYNGFDDTRMNGWLIIPAFLKREKYPCMLHYHGLYGSRGNPSDFMHWIMQGIAVLSIDCRQQGGVTGNSAKYTTNGLISSVTTQGILNKYEYYYRAVYMDSLKALDYLETRDEIDMGSIVLSGASQGGALVMAVAGLDSRAKIAMADVPSYSDINERILGGSGSFSAVKDYLRRYPNHLEAVTNTLSYFDTMNMAANISCEVYASVGLEDPVCPARLYFATYNRITSKKNIEVYPFNLHDGGAHVHVLKQMKYLRDSGILE